MTDTMEMVELSADNPDDMFKDVYLDGVKVSNFCFWAKVPAESGVEAPGEVGLFVRGESGAIKINGYGDPIEEYKTGTVKWEPIGE